MKKFILAVLIVFWGFSVPIYASETLNTIGNWETAIYLNNNKFITRVALDNENKIAIKLRELCEAMGYSVEWIGNEQRIALKKDSEELNLFINQTFCVKNNEEIQIEKPVFIDNDVAYLPQSFLQTVFKIDTIAIDQASENKRINGVFLVEEPTSQNGFVVVSSSDFELEVKPNDTTIQKDTLLFNFSLGIDKESKTISMDYEQFIKNNSAKIAGIVKEQLEKVNQNDFSNSQKMDEFKIYTINELNKAFHINFIKYIYITESTWHTPLK